MAYDRELADRIRSMVSAEPITEKTMFGGLAFMLNGNMSVSASGQGGLLVRVDPALTDALVAEPGAEVFEMGGRGAMVGWIRVTPDVLDDEATLARWVERGVAFARTLPPK